MEAAVFRRRDEGIIGRLVSNEGEEFVGRRRRHAEIPAARRQRCRRQQPAEHPQRSRAGGNKAPRSVAAPDQPRDESRPSHRKRTQHEQLRHEIPSPRTEIGKNEQQRRVADDIKRDCRASRRLVQQRQHRQSGQQQQNGSPQVSKAQASCRLSECPVKLLDVLNRRKKSIMEYELIANAGPAHKPLKDPQRRQCRDWNRQGQKEKNSKPDHRTSTKEEKKEKHKKTQTTKKKKKKKKKNNQPPHPPPN